MSSRDDSVLPENASLISAHGLFQLEAGVRYTFAADVRAEIPTSPFLRVQEDEPLFTEVHQVRVEVGTEYRTVSTSFVAQANHVVEIAFWFGEGRANTYCVDNVFFVKGTL